MENFIFCAVIIVHVEDSVTRIRHFEAEEVETQPTLCHWSHSRRRSRNKYQHRRKQYIWKLKKFTVRNNTF